jgi:hypothetical protein
MRRLVFLGGVLVVLAGSLAILQLSPGAPPVSGPPAATLVVLTGSAQVTRAGTRTAAVARGGDQLRPGDRVATGPGTRARLSFVSGDQLRLDSGTVVSIVAATVGSEEVSQSSGRTWARNLSGGTLTVSAGGGVHRSKSRGDEFAVDLTAPTEPPAGQASPWAALNQALDRDPSPGGPSALGAGMLLPGEESAAQQAVTVPVGGPAPSLYFTAGWTAGSLELEVVDPDGNVQDRASGADRPLSLVVHSAKSGGWQYRVRQLEGGEEGDSWFVVISQLAG